MRDWTHGSSDSIFGWNPHYLGKIERGTSRLTKKHIFRPIGHKIRKVYTKAKDIVTFKGVRARRAERKKEELAEQKRAEKARMYLRGTYTEHSEAVKEQQRLKELGYRTNVQGATVTKADGSTGRQWSVSTVGKDYELTKEEKDARAEQDRVIAQTKKAEAKAEKQKRHEEAKAKRDVQIATLKAEWAMKKSTKAMGKALGRETKIQEAVIQEQKQQKQETAIKVERSGILKQKIEAQRPKSTFVKRMTSQKLQQRLMRYHQKRSAVIEEQKRIKEQRLSALRERIAQQKQKKQAVPNQKVHSFIQRLQRLKQKPIKLVPPREIKEPSAKQKAYANRAKYNREAPQRKEEMLQKMAQGGAGEEKEMMPPKSRERIIGKKKLKKIQKSEAIKANAPPAVDVREAQVKIATPPKKEHRLTKEPVATMTRAQWEATIKKAKKQQPSALSQAKRKPAKKIVVRVSKAEQARPASIDNPYMKMNIERVSEDAGKGVVLAKEALKYRIKK